MSLYFSAEKLISEAKKAGISFKNSDPYNRLRYYTKIGWLPHMERRKSASGKVVGHYPTWALETLILIENSKARGLANTEISSKVAAHQAKRNLGNIFKFLNSPEKRFRAAVYSLVFLLLAILLIETGVIKLGNTTKQELLSAPITISADTNQIIASGSGIVSEGDTTVFVRAPQVTPQSKIYVSFEDSYSPALRYWVSRKISFEGFYVELDSPVSQNVRFNWWLSN